MPIKSEAKRASNELPDLWRGRAQNGRSVSKKISKAAVANPCYTIKVDNAAAYF